MKSHLNRSQGSKSPPSFEEADRHHESLVHLFVPLDDGPLHVRDLVSTVVGLDPANGGGQSKKGDLDLDHIRKIVAEREADEAVTARPKIGTAEIVAKIEALKEIETENGKEATIEIGIGVGIIAVNAGAKITIVNAGGGKNENGAENRIVKKDIEVDVTKKEVALVRVLNQRMPTKNGRFPTCHLKARSDRKWLTIRKMSLMI